MKNHTLILLAFLLLSFSTQAQPPEYNTWIMKADSLYKAGQYQHSANAFTQAFASFGGKGMILDRYNAACAWAHAGNKDSAFFQLDRIAIKAHYSDIGQLTEDADLKTLHADKRWDELCTVVKQNKEKAEAGLDKPLTAELDTIFENDQQYRQRLNDVQAKFGNNSKEMKALWDTISYNDSIDLLKVSAILDSRGWPGPDVVGGRGSDAVFLVIQHADIKTQEKYLPMMRDAVKAHKADAGSLALLEDRVAMRHGGKQIYGSQLLADVDGKFICPITDPDNLDKRRAEVGLEPMSEYMQHFGLTWNLEEYKKQLPDLERRRKLIYPD